MAYVKISYAKNANSLIHYVFREKAPEDPVHADQCPDNEPGAKQMFQAVRDLHNAKEGIQAIHVIQSWSPEESKNVTPEKMNEMGKALAGQYFEGHQFLVVTHTHDEHYHNHIVVNSIHAETGKRITNKKKHLYQLRERSDQICRENGLSVINGEAKDRQARLPEHVHKIERYNGNSYIHAMKDNALFARKYATSFDEYAGYLDSLGVQLRIKDKSITYFYEDKPKGKRGDKLGREFTKDGLEAAFKENHAAFSNRPELRARIRSEFERGNFRQGDPIRNSGNVLLDGRHASSGDTKDFKAFTESRRAFGDRCTPSDDKLRNCIIPIEAIRRARMASIPEYCARHKIELTRNDQGKQILKGRDHVVIEETQWHNTRNKTKGSAVEFAAIHGNLTYLQSIARINNMPGLLELERNFGEQSRKFSSFHVPRRDEANYPKTMERLGRFLTSFGTDPNAAKPLFEGGRIMVSKNGMIRLFPKGDKKNALEFTEDRQGKWSPAKRGHFTSPFFSSPGRSPRAVVFSDPRKFMEKRGIDLLSDRNRKDGVLVLMEPSAEQVGSYLKQNPHIKEVALVTKNRAKPDQGELDFFGTLRTHFKSVGIEVCFTEFDKALTRRGPDLSL